MNEAINEQLLGLREKMTEKKRLQRRMSTAKEQLDRQRKELQKMSDILAKEEADVRGLEGLSLTGLFYTVLGTKEKNLDKEKQEFLAAKLKHDSCKYAINSTEGDIEVLQKEIDILRGIESEYDKLIKSKEKLLENSGNSEYDKVADEMVVLRSRIREMNEAVIAGNTAENFVARLVSLLDSASNWGLFDMVGGGLIATSMKYSKIDEAKKLVDQVNSAVKKFIRELSDINVNLDTDHKVKIGAFGEFADYFFDGLIVDWSVQNKIDTSLQRAKGTLNEIREIMKYIIRDYNSAKSRFGRLEKQKLQLVEKA